MNKRKVIIVTDGDWMAQRAVETAASNIGGRCISRSAGNPTPLSGSEIISLIKETPKDPVVVMVDDRGDCGVGAGEKAMQEILRHEDIEVIGIIAVASNTRFGRGVKVQYSVDKDGNIIDKAVDKFGDEKMNKKNKILKGDTVNILADMKGPLIVGVGDPGKMNGKDSIYLGAPIITKAMELIIEKLDSKANNIAT